MLKNQFLTDLYVKSAGKRYELIFPVIYLNGFHHVFVVPIGYSSDFASIPKIFRPIINNDDQHIRRAAVLHDYLYETKTVTRQEADKLMYESMLSVGASRIKALTVYIALRLGGWLAWDG
jgi:hypothetical protein